MDSNAKQVLKNMEFVDKLREASNITSKISEVEAMSDSKQKDTGSLTGDKKRLSELKQELNDLTTSYVSHKYTKEGASRTNIIDQWLEQTLLFEKAKAELLIVQNARQELNDRYVFFAPVGTTIKQKRTLHQLYGAQLPDRVTELQRSPVEKEKSGNDFCYIESAQ